MPWQPETVVQTWKYENLEDMLDTLRDVKSVAGLFGHRADTVYPDQLQVSLVEVTLSDGSTVMNLQFHNGARGI